MSDDSRHYEIKNELSSANNKLGAIDKQSYDINRNVELLTEWAVVVGIAMVSIALINLIIMIMLFVIATKIG